jgi:hypothetical protein
MQTSDMAYGVLLDTVPYNARYHSDAVPLPAGPDYNYDFEARDRVVWLIPVDHDTSNLSSPRTWQEGEIRIYEEVSLVSEAYDCC